MVLGVVCIQFVVIPHLDHKAQSTAQTAEAQPSALISNAPLPPRCKLQMNLSQSWSKWRKVWTAQKMVTNLASQPSLFHVAAFIACTSPYPQWPAFETELDKQSIENILDLWNSNCLVETTIATKHQMNLVMHMLLLFMP